MKPFPILIGATLFEALKSHVPGLGHVVPPEVFTALLTSVSGTLAGICATVTWERRKEAANREFAAKNHHLRLGFAEALRKALASTRAAIPADALDSRLAARFDHWDANLALASDRANLDRLIPPLLEEDVVAASTGWASGPEAEKALGELLQSWLTRNPALARSWTAEDARKLAAQVLPFCFAEFSRAAIADDGPLFRAFVVNGQNQLLRDLGDLASLIEKHADRIIATLAPFIAPPSTVRPADWLEPPNFVPRPDLLRRIAGALLTDPARSRPVSVWGLPGSGKSTLCERFASDHRGDFPGGYARLRLEPQTPATAEKLRDALCERYGIKGAPSQLTDRLAATLREPRTLIHIENADGDDAARAAAGLALQLPGCAIMISGRQATLGEAIRWERVHVEEFTPPQAMRQLSDELRHGPRNHDEARQWERLFARCGHLPLAIHLCAGALRTRTVGEILERLLELTPTDPGDPVPGLRAAFEISWGLFASHANRPHQTSPEEDGAKWTGALCAFAAAPLTGVGRKLGAAICGLEPCEYHAVMETASSLSLVVRDDTALPERDPPRYRCHTLIREFAGGKDGDATRRGQERMSQWFLDHLDVDGNQEIHRTRRREVGVEEDALAAWLETLDAEQAQAALRRGNLYARRHGPGRAWRAAAEKALEMSEPFDGWAFAALVAADVSLSLGDVEASLRWATAVRDRARDNGEERTAALGAGQIADIFEARGDLDEALRIRREDQLPVYEKLGDIHSRAIAMGKIADIAEARGDLDEALRIRRDEALPVYEKLGDIRERAVTMGKIADIAQARGDLDEALRIRREDELPVYEKLGDIRARAVTILKIALVEAGQGKLAEADRIFDAECIPVFERLGARVDLVRARFLHARIKAALGQVEVARALAERALEDAGKLGLLVAANIRKFLDGLG